MSQAMAGSSSWSLDGKRIAFISTTPGEDLLSVINAEGSDHVNVTNHPG